MRGAASARHARRRDRDLGLPVPPPVPRRVRRNASRAPERGEDGPGARTAPRERAAGDRGLLRGGLSEPGQLQRGVLAPRGLLAASLPCARGRWGGSRLAARLLRPDGMSRQPSGDAISEKRRVAPTWQNSRSRRRRTVRITLVSIHVENQDRALAFYRD